MSSTTSRITDVKGHPPINPLTLSIDDAGLGLLPQSYVGDCHGARPQPKISASVLAIKDKPENEIIAECLLARNAGVDLIHFDVVGGVGRKTDVVEEGSAVTNKIFTPLLLARMKLAAQQRGLILPVDVHIMDMQPTYDLIRPWLLGGADYVTLHWEAYRNKEDLKRVLLFIKGEGVKTGIAFRPDTDITSVLEFLKDFSHIELVSQAGVLPCVGGQVLDFGILRNLRALVQQRSQSGLRYEIMVDGGIEPEIAGPKCFREGADILVAGTAFFGHGRRDQVTMHSVLQAIRLASEVLETNIYDAIADRIIELHHSAAGQLWVSIEGYHGSGKTFTTDRISEKLGARGFAPVVVNLDLSWTARSNRANWSDEANRCRARGLDHNYFHPLRQDPPMHWRKDHSDLMLAALEKCRSGCVQVDGCYQFNAIGDANGNRMFQVNSRSILIVEGVYVSELRRRNWDLRIYIVADPERAKEVAMIRDVTKVHRPSVDTKKLYEEVYEPAYREYLTKQDPLEQADIVINRETVPGEPAIRDARVPMLLLKCTNAACSQQKGLTRISACPHCGHDLLHEIVGPVDFLNSIDEDQRNMWRYHRLLPVSRENIVTAQEGYTSVKFLEQTSNRLGVNIWTKMEIENPTGTFKDREASYVISRSRQFHNANIVMQSTGNTAVAMAHYSGVAGIPSWSFVPKLSAYKLLMPAKSECGRIIAVDGHPIDVKAVAEDFAACFGYPKVSPFYERCECNKTIGYEVAETLLRGELPEQGRLHGASFDYYVQTLSAGMGLIGYYAAMEYAQKWTSGKIRVPRMVAIEISEFAPIQKAWDQGLEQLGEAGATPFFPDHPLYEPTLWTTNVSKYYPHLRRMLEASNGMLDAVTPHEVNAMVEQYGIAEEVENLGYRLSLTEKAAFIGFAGLAKKVELGEIPRGSNIILMLTGKGFREDFVHVVPDFIADPNVDKPYDILRGALVDKAGKS